MSSVKVSSVSCRGTTYSLLTSRANNKVYSRLLSFRRSIVLPHEIHHPEDKGRLGLLADMNHKVHTISHVLRLQLQITARDKGHEFQLVGDMKLGVCWFHTLRSFINVQSFLSRLWTTERRKFWAPANGETSRIRNQPEETSGNDGFRVARTSDLITRFVSRQRRRRWLVFRRHPFLALDVKWDLAGDTKRLSATSHVVCHFVFVTLLKLSSYQNRIGCVSLHYSSL